MAECLHVHTVATSQRAISPQTAARGESREYFLYPAVRRRNNPDRSHSHAVCLPDDCGQTRTQNEPQISHPRGPRTRTPLSVVDRPQHREHQEYSSIFQASHPTASHLHGTTQGHHPGTGTVNSAGIISAVSRQGCQTQLPSDYPGAFGITAH
jgi:hypothetical protein